VEVNLMKNDATDRKRAWTKSAATTPGPVLDAPGATTNQSPPRKLDAQRPIAGPTWARYIDSRMKHFGSR
jgi:hypothetical protein